jgi:hypothetical protein
VLLLLLLLQVSDVGPVPERLQQGQVITVEPGLYFMPLLLQRAFSDPKQVRRRCCCCCCCWWCMHVRL